MTLGDRWVRMGRVGRRGTLWVRGAGSLGGPLLWAVCEDGPLRWVPCEGELSQGVCVQAASRADVTESYARFCRQRAADRVRRRREDRARVLRWRALDPERLERALARQRRAVQVRAADGALVGRRTWLIRLGDGVLISPHQGTEWHGPALSAHAWSDSEVVGGECGLHAVALSVRQLSAPAGVVTGRVRGYGRYVIGRYESHQATSISSVIGWRAERQVIDRLEVDPSTPAETVRGLEGRYQCRVILRQTPTSQGGVSCES